MIILLAILGYLVLLAIGLSLSAAAKRGDSMIAKIEWQPGRRDAAEAPEDSPCEILHTVQAGATTGGEQAVMTREEACLDWFGGAVEPFCLMGANEEMLYSAIPFFVSPRR